MIIIYLKDFITTGRFGPVELGMTIDQVIKFLGEPEKKELSENGNYVAIYGYYEFLYLKKSQILYGIQNYNLSNFLSMKPGWVNNEEGICFTNNKFTVDIWFLEKNRRLTFLDVVNNLEKEDIDFSIECGSLGNKLIKCNSGVKIDFWDMNRMAWYHKDTDTFTYTEKIENEDEKILLGIQYLDLSLENGTPHEEALAEYLFPELSLEKLFDKPDMSKALAFYHKYKRDENVISTAGKLIEKMIQQKEYAKVNQLAEMALDHFTDDYLFMLTHIGDIAFAAVNENNQSLIDKLVKQLSNREAEGLTGFSGYCASSCEYASNIGQYASHLRSKDTFIQATRLYEIALDIQPSKPCTQRLELFCNALWILQHDNTGLPVDKTLNEKFLTKCLPYAPGNPAIFFNALCLYVEMGEFDKALQCYTQAVNYKYNNVQMMKDQIQSEKVFAEFKKYPPLKGVL